MMQHKKGLNKLLLYCLGILAVAVALVAGLGWVCITHPLWLVLGLGAGLLLLACYLVLCLAGTALFSFCLAASAA